MIRARAALAVWILMVALGPGAWLAPARGASDDGEVIIIDGCAPNKVELNGECVFVEDLFGWGGSAGAEPTLDWGIVIHVPGSGGSGTGGPGPTDESCRDEFTDCLNACWTAFDQCEEVAWAVGGRCGGDDVRLVAA
jgi:hypothetical protein